MDNPISRPLTVTITDGELTSIEEVSYEDEFDYIHQLENDIAAEIASGIEPRRIENCYNSGTVQWRLPQTFVLHRTDGPAVIWPDGVEEYWIAGKRVENFY